MKISPTNNASAKLIRYNHIKYTYDLKTHDTVCFKGHVSAEKYGKRGINILRKETGFFRDWKTLNIIKKYIEEDLKDKKIIRIVSGGCSTGEEATSLSIVLDDVKEKVKIIGIDLSKDAIKQAKSRKFVLQDIKNLPDGFDVENFALALKDRFLTFDTGRELSETEKLQKKLFEKFFDVTDEVVPKEKISLKQRFQNFITKLIFPKYKPIAYESKIVKLKEGKVNNCTFINGDITDINNLLGEKSDIILFKNAIYHLISEDICNGMMRRAKPNSEEIAENIILELRKNLNNGGLICFGEDELLQTMDSDIVPKVMRKLGFKPYHKAESGEINIWQKKLKINLS